MVKKQFNFFIENYPPPTTNTYLPVFVEGSVPDIRCLCLY